MRWIALPVGILILVWTLVDVCRTLVIPRAARGRIRLSRALYQLMWRPWRWVGLRSRSAQGRERLLSAAAPSLFFVLLAGWVALALLGYALILWSPAFVHGLGVDVSFGDALYASGTSLFTLGFGGMATGWTRAVEIAAAATGQLQRT
jgi:hypothetical protein